MKPWLKVHRPRKVGDSWEVSVEAHAYGRPLALTLKTKTTPTTAILRFLRSKLARAGVEVPAFGASVRPKKLPKGVRSYVAAAKEGRTDHLEKAAKAALRGDPKARAALKRVALIERADELRQTAAKGAEEAIERIVAIRAGAATGDPAAAELYDVLLGLEEEDPCETGCPGLDPLEELFDDSDDELVEVEWDVDNMDENDAEMEIGRRLLRPAGTDVALAAFQRVLSKSAELPAADFAGYLP